eukprot:362698-Rhodomonas_salina.2
MDCWYPGTGTGPLTKVASLLGVLEAPAEAEGQVRFAGARLDLKPSQSRPASDTPGTRSR